MGFYNREIPGNMQMCLIVIILRAKSLLPAVRMHHIRVMDKATRQESLELLSCLLGEKYAFFMDIIAC